MTNIFSEGSIFQVGKPLALHLLKYLLKACLERSSRVSPSSMQNLVAYILTAMLSWVPLHSLTTYGETEEQASSRLHSIASDIAFVALDPNEPPVFARGDGRMKTALLQAAIASLETGYQKFVDDASCNRADWHADRRGNCDGGHAWSLWQVHIFGNGYIFKDDGTLGTAMTSSAWLSSHPEEVVIKGPQMVADRKVAVRVAQRLERTSLLQYHSLCGYSGESCEEGRHPKAKARMDRAMDYLQRHPYKEASSSEEVSSTTTASND